MLKKTPTHLSSICSVLASTYPDAHCELLFETPFELLIATILSAQCTDVQVNIVTRDLFAKYRSPEDYVRVPLPELENDLRRIGLFRNKAKNLQACCQMLLENFGGELPRTIEELTRLAGVGRKTANVVLGNAFEINSGIVVDTHVARLAYRLGFTTETDPLKIEQQLMKIVPREQWTLFSHWLIWHGRRRCSARKPDCAGCEVGTLCPKKIKE